MTDQPTGEPIIVSAGHLVRQGGEHEVAAFDRVVLDFLGARAP